MQSVSLLSLNLWTKKKSSLLRLNVFFVRFVLGFSVKMVPHHMWCNKPVWSGAVPQASPETELHIFSIYSFILFWKCCSKRALWFMVCRLASPEQPENRPCLPGGCCQKKKKSSGRPDKLLSHWRRNVIRGMEIKCRSCNSLSKTHTHTHTIPFPSAEILTETTLCIRVLVLNDSQSTASNLQHS